MSPRSRCAARRRPGRHRSGPLRLRRSGWHRPRNQWQGPRQNPRRKPHRKPNKPTSGKSS